MDVEDIIEEEQKVPVNSLRQLTFQELKNFREKKRAESFDARRIKIGEVHLLKDQTVLGAKEIRGICSRIKRRKQAEENDLLALSNGFLQSQENITAFIKTTGAINVLVKEFIGSDSGKQNLAGECLCNLAMGYEICCEKVVEFAGSYLTIYILNLTNFRLVRTCLWICQNICASGDKPLKILFSQKLVKNVLHVMNHVMFEEIKQECYTLLYIILTNGQQFMSDEDKESILNSVVAQLKTCSNDTKVYQNLYKILTVIKYSISPAVSFQLIELISTSLFDIFHQNKIFNDIELACMLMIRILSNLFCINDQNLVKFVEIVLLSNLSLATLINQLSANYFGLVKEFLWFAGNIQNCNNEFVQNFLLKENLMENLKISRIFLL